MAMYGSNGEFESGREDWLSYSEHLQQYFTANDTELAVQSSSVCAV